jgi:hypothetical protein
MLESHGFFDGQILSWFFRSTLMVKSLVFQGAVCRLGLQETVRAGSSVLVAASMVSLVVLVWEF